MLIAGVVGLLLFAAMISGGLLLYQRVYGDSIVALVVILAVFGGLGAYLGWLVGVLVFSTVRGSDDGDGEGVNGHPG
jgi:hypothetical protein